MENNKELVFVRTLAAPRDVVWKAFTDAAELQKWWGPKGAVLEDCTVDLRVGGMFHYSMHFPGQGKMWAKFTYKEIDPPSKLVFTNSFSDEQKGTSGNPWLPVWPAEVLNTLTLEDRGNETLLTLRGYPTNATEEEIQAYENLKDNMKEGFAGTWEKLDTYLKTL